MKHISLITGRKWQVAVAACLLMLAGCGEENKTADTRIAVEGVELDRPSLELEEGTFDILTATITPLNATDQRLLWISSNTRIAAVENGKVTAEGKGTATITVTSVDGGHKATCTVTVKKADHPIFGAITFRTDKIWIVGEQMWSDAVMGSRCKKDDFYGGDMQAKEYNVDCCQNEGYGDMFSWEAVNQYKADLCPDGWRVPTTADFCLLDRTLNDRTDCNQRGNDVAARKRYEDPAIWGGEYSGHVRVNIIQQTGKAAYYWSQTTTDDRYGIMLDFYNDNNYVNPGDMGPRDFGMPVRCVKE
jgi:uncharacterized protein (TIGR02145 family)